MSFQTFAEGELYFIVRFSKKPGWYRVSSKREKPEEKGGDEEALQPTQIDSDAYEAWRTGMVDVSAAQLYNRLIEFFTTWFHASDDRVPVLLALYTMASYCYQAVDEVAYLALDGEAGSGKTLLANLLASTCFNAKLSSGVSLAAIGRIVHRTGGTLILDEQDVANGRWAEVLRAGYRANLDLVVSGPGPDSIISRRVYGPKILVSNDQVRDEALATRTIPIPLLNRAAAPRRYDRVDVEALAAPLRTDLVLFALEHVHRLRRSALNVTTHVGLQNRELDLAALLLAISELVDEQAVAAPTHAMSDLLSFMKALASHRKASFRDEGLRAVFARCVLALNVSENDLVKAETLCAHVNDSGLLGRRITTRELGRHANRLKLVLHRVVKDDTCEARHDQNAPNVTSTPMALNRRKGANGLKPPRIQKQFYRLNVLLARQWIAELEQNAP